MGVIAMMSPLRCSRDTWSHVPEIWHISVVLAVQGISINPSILPMGILMGRLSLHSMSSNLWMLLLQFCSNLCVQCCCWYHICGLSITCLSNGLLRICFVGVYARHVVISYCNSNDRGNVSCIFISLVLKSFLMCPIVMASFWMWEISIGIKVKWPLLMQ